MKEVLAKAESKMGKTIARLESDYAAIRAGRANPAVLDKVMVDYYGAPTPVNQLAAVSVAEARVLTIQPWDGSVCRAIERAIQTSDIGINPQSDGKTIRLIFPPLTEEKRKDIVKDVSHMAEEAKIALRSIRRDAMEKLKAMKKDGELTEDDLKQAEKKTQEQRDAEEKSGKMADYNIFMAMVEKVGHDKRGNPLFKRDKEGNEILVPDTNSVLVLGETGEGQRTVSHEQKVKVEDDQTPDVPAIFAEWKRQEGLGW